MAKLYTHTHTHTHTLTMLVHGIDAALKLFPCSHSKVLQFPVQYITVPVDEKSTKMYHIEQTPGSQTRQKV